jgi:AbrB family looped-hinge helix DNA binding protein
MLYSHDIHNVVGRLGRRPPPAAGAGNSNVIRSDAFQEIIPPKRPSLFITPGSPVDVSCCRHDLTGKTILEVSMVRLATTKLSSKGQVVIPEAIRDRLGLEAGVQFVVVAEGDVVVLKVLKAPNISDFKALLDEAQKSAEAAGLTAEDIEEALREVRAKT